MHTSPAATLLLLTSTLLALSACDSVDNSDSETDRGDWSEISSFEGVPRSNAVAFSIDGKGYLGTGYDGDDPLKDFWQYDPDLNFWVQKADFPGTARSAAVGFVINGQGYLGTGYNADVEDDYLKDFWRYDPETNDWQPIADFGGSARYGAVAFSTEGKGYVGTGHDGNGLKDFWAYDPSTGEWTQVVSLPGDKRIDAVAFVIDDKAYVGTGRNNGVYEVDFWEYDPVSGQWTRKNDLDEDADGDSQALPRSNAVAFALNGKGYISLGESGGLLSSLWEYEPGSDVWTQLANYEALARQDAVAFTLGDRAYVGTGVNSSTRFDDVWVLDPTIENSDDD